MLNRPEYDGELESEYPEDELPFETFELFRRTGEFSNNVFGKIRLCIKIVDETL